MLQHSILGLWLGVTQTGNAVKDFEFSITEFAADFAL